MEVKLMSSAKRSAKLEVSDVIFAREFNETLVHQVVTAYMSAGRAGTRRQKTRAERRGGGAKPWAQKGTGRARAGTSRSPLWRKGGVTFAARPQDHSQKVNRKMYRAALQCILSELVRQGRLVIVKEIKLAAPKTKEILGFLKDYSLENVLIVTESADENLYLAARNLMNINVIDVASMDPVSLIRHEKVMMTEDAIKRVQEQLG